MSVLLCLQDQLVQQARQLEEAQRQKLELEGKVIGLEDTEATDLAVGETSQDTDDTPTSHLHHSAIPSVSDQVKKVDNPSVFILEH